ncbi:MAG: hypothetical protein OEW60_04775 [Thiovulaceae bacterium]|nr:hypothetical protein [Sulfurimonadaceae bacterium]
MNFLSRIKHYFRSAFREIIVYHNSSLEFRAKLFTIVAGANEEFSKAEHKIIKEAAQKIYHDDPNRVETLLLAIKEYIEKIREKNDLGIDELARDIINNIKRNKRFVEKIDTKILEPLLTIQDDPDVKDYQRHIIDFLDNLKEEYSEKKVIQP